MKLAEGHGAGSIRAAAALTKLDPERYSSLAASLDGTIYLPEKGGWRLQAFRSGGASLFEMALPSARCLVAGGLVHGLGVADLVNREFLRFDQNGGTAFRTAIEGHGIASLWLTPSGESVWLDSDLGAVIFRDQGFREVRRWPVRGNGRPQSLAADLLEGLVAVAYPDDGRLDTYSVLGVPVDSRRQAIIPGAQSLAIDGRGRLWAAEAGGNVVVLVPDAGRWSVAASIEIPGLKALAPGPGNSVFALGLGQVTELTVE